MDNYKPIESYWSEHFKDPFTPNEAVVYYYLIEEWRKGGNINPFPVNSSRAELALNMPKKTFFRCREKLQKRGLITYKEGKGKGNYPYYFLRCDTVSDTVSDTVAKEEIPPTPPKEENIYINHQQQLCACTCEKNLEDLKNALMKADSWIESVRMALYRNYKIILTEDQIKERLSDYFIHLQSEGIEVKTEQDAKSHFKNWIAKVHEIENKKQKDGERIQNGSRSSYTSKQEANEYAFSQFVRYREARENGLLDEVEKPF